MVGHGNSRRWIAGAVMLLLGCGGSRRTNEDGGDGVPDAGEDVALGLDCSDLVDEAPGITPGCPIGDPCPTAPECEFCDDTCPDPMGFGAPLVDGIYELRSVVAYISSCGSWSQELASGTLRVSGSTIDILWTRPWLYDGPPTRGARYSFRQEGEELVVEQLCPTEGAETTRVPYATVNGVLWFPSSFPSGQEVFSMVFEKR